MIKRLKWFAWKTFNFWNLNLTGVFVVVIHEGQVLLIKKRLGVVMGWQIPGGGLKNGKKLKDGAQDELYEETGIRVKRLELLDVVNFPKYWNLMVAYTGHEIVGTQEPCVQDNFEIAKAEWVPIKKAMSLLIEPHRPFLAEAVTKMGVQI
jgi:ADP-ribose pyrophosphatase YjhB (NUDIX family)